MDAPPPPPPPAKDNLARRLVAEAAGTALLLATVVGSGIMGERLAGGSAGLALLANALATGAGLVALILAFGPISGAHFNPAVTIADASQGGLPWREAAGYVAAQVAGALAGVALANLMFGEPALFLSRRERHAPGELLGEVVATFGLLSVIWGCARRRPDATPLAVGAYIVAAYWFTSSTSFANPASPRRRRSASPPSSRRARRSSSRWAAATRARPCPGSGATTGRSRTRKESPSPACARSATRSASACARSSPPRASRALRTTTLFPVCELPQHERKPTGRRRDNDDPCS